MWEEQWDKRFEDCPLDLKIGDLFVYAMPGCQKKFGLVIGPDRSYSDLDWFVYLFGPRETISFGFRRPCYWRRVTKEEVS